MRKFLRDILLFSLPLITAGVLVLFTDLPRNFRYNYLKDDCEGRGNWISRQLENGERADIVFVGASRTIRAVDDSLLELKFDSAGKPARIINAGYCRFGRDLQGIIAGDMLDSKTGLKKLVIEVSEREGISGHPVFYCLAGTEELLHPPSRLNQEYIGNVYKGGLMRLDYWKQQVLHQEEKIARPGNRYGCLHTEHRADKNELEASRQHCADGKNCRPAGNLENLQLRYAKAWLEKITRDAKANNCEVLFLFLPAYGCSSCPPREQSFYAQFGRVMIPPRGILENTGYWSDHDHFNSFGSRAISNWLFSELQKD